MNRLLVLASSIFLLLVFMACDLIIKCPMPDDPQCGPNERVVSSSDEQGCTISICEPRGCPPPQELRCTANETLVVVPDERGCRINRCEPLECSMPIPIICELDEELVAETDSNGCSTFVCKPTVCDNCEPAEEFDCTIPPTAGRDNLNMQGCTGKIITSGSMNGSDQASTAEQLCEESGQRGSCCSFHLFGEGEWFLTDGSPIVEGGIPNEASWGRAAGQCSFSVDRPLPEPSPEPIPEPEPEPEPDPPLPEPPTRDAGCAFDEFYCQEARQYAPQPGYFHIGVHDYGECAGQDVDMCPDDFAAYNYTIDPSEESCRPDQTYRCEKVNVGSECIVSYHFHYCD